MLSTKYFRSLRLTSIERKVKKTFFQIQEIYTINVMTLFNQLEKGEDLIKYD
jgi:hypothetical protein